MQPITNEGNYKVKITSGQKPPSEKNDGSFTVELVGETEDGYFAKAFMSFNHTIIKGGKNVGKSNFEVSRQTLKRLGVPDGMPGGLEKMIKEGTLEAEFVLKWNEYNGNRTLKVAFINPVSKGIPLGQVDWEQVMKDFYAGVTTPQAHSETEKVEVEEVDEIPF